MFCMPWLSLWLVMTRYGSCRRIDVSLSYWWWENLKALAVAGKDLFRNCLVAMKPKAVRNDMPSTHDVTTYIHNQFVKWLKELKSDILVSFLNNDHVTYSMNSREHHGAQTLQKHHFWGWRPTGLRWRKECGSWDRKWLGLNQYQVITVGGIWGDILWVYVSVLESVLKMYPRWPIRGWADSMSYAYFLFSI